MKEVGIWEDDVISHERAKKLSVKESKIGESDKCWLSLDFRYLATKYPDGRISTHLFSDWPDGEVRCDCEWKRFNWNSQCKHEKARERIINEREPAK